MTATYDGKLIIRVSDKEECGRIEPCCEEMARAFYAKKVDVFKCLPYKSENRCISVTTHDLTQFGYCPWCGSQVQIIRDYDTQEDDA